MNTTEYIKQLENAIDCVYWALGCTDGEAYDLINNRAKIKDMDDA